VIDEPGFFTVFRSRRMAVLFGLGFSSGLPLMLTGQTLQAWAKDAGVDVQAIAGLAAVGLAIALLLLGPPRRASQQDLDPVTATGAPE
jgi:PAT family beta-lactamase induction signal transducer AmpG